MHTCIVIKLSRIDINRVKSIVTKVQVVGFGYSDTVQKESHQSELQFRRYGHLKFEFKFESDKSSQKGYYWIDLNMTKNLPLVSSSLDLRLKRCGQSKFRG